MEQAGSFAGASFLNIIPGNRNSSDLGTFIKFYIEADIHQLVSIVDLIVGSYCCLKVAVAFEEFLQCLLRELDAGGIVGIFVREVRYLQQSRVWKSLV